MLPTADGSRGAGDGSSVVASAAPEGGGSGQRAAAAARGGGGEGAAPGCSAALPRPLAALLEGLAALQLSRDVCETPAAALTQAQLLRGALHGQAGSGGGGGAGGAGSPSLAALQRYLHRRSDCMAQIVVHGAAA
eukprot:358044-Chlamydomonas_euryale.AAC.1